MAPPSGAGVRCAAGERRLPHRQPHSRIRPTATDVPVHRCINLQIRWLSLRTNQRTRAHELPRLTVPALRDVEVSPRREERIGIAAAQSFNGRHRTRADRRQRCHARSHCLAVQVDGAGSSRRDATPELGAGQVQLTAQHPQQRRVRFSRHVDRSPVQLNGRHRRHASRRGRNRSRVPVAAKIAFATAGAIGGNGGSPTPSGCSMLGMISTTIAGHSDIRSGR